MTTATIYGGSPIKAIRVEGHSGYAEQGADIVCSGISALTTAFINLCIQYGEDDWVEVTGIEQHDGFLFMQVIDRNDMLKSAIDMLEVGFEGIQSEYREFFSYSRLDK